MGRNIGTFRTKTRYKLQKERRDQGKISLTKFFQRFEIGETVHLQAEPAYQKGMYFPRFYGRTGTVVGKKRFCYEISIIDGGKKKILVVHPVHLQRSATKVAAPKAVAKKATKKAAPKAAAPKETIA